MNVSRILKQHYKSLKGKGFRGVDIYDGLQSRLFQKSPFFRSRFLRLAWIQLFKRLPVNLRSLFSVAEGYNAKGLALFIRGLSNLHRLSGEEEYLSQALALAGIIISQKAPGRDYFCAGYNFHWESRSFSVPAFTPNMVVSSFAGQAFLDLYEATGNQKWLAYSIDIGKFIDTELKLGETEDKIVYGYIPGEDTIVHNANLMGSALMARLYDHTGEKRYRESALKSARYSADAQREDGAWPYGETGRLGWVDNFHTGFNLVALKEVRDNTGTTLWNGNIESGLQYHMKNHFLDDMTPKYFDDRLYPIDIHNFAQGVVTFIAFAYEDKARKLLEKSIDLMWDGRKHYFYYRKTRWYTNRIDYIRWSQAWMFYAMTEYRLYETGRKPGDNEQ